MLPQRYSGSVIPNRAEKLFRVLLGPVGGHVLMYSPGIKSRPTRFVNFIEKPPLSSIKRDVKKKVLPRPDGEKIFVSRSSPLPVSVPLRFAREARCGLFAISVAFIFRW